MKRKLILFIIFISLFLYFPYTVNASGISYGDCFAKYGTVEFVETGDNNYKGGMVFVDFEKDEDVGVGIIEVDAQAMHSHTVKNVKYELTDIEGNTCSGVVSGTSIEENSGNVKLNFIIQNEGIKKMDFRLTNLTLVEKNEVESVTVSQVYVNARTFDKLTVDTPFICEPEIKQMIVKYWKYIVVGTPILLMVMATVDFMKAMMSNDSDAIQKSGSNALKRAIAMFILLFSPTILTIIFKWFGLESAICF